MGKINDNSARPPAKGSSKPKADPYAEAKKRDPKLDSYIKIRNNSDKSSTQWKEAQNSINAAYQKGPQRDATPSEDVTKGRSAEEAYAEKYAIKQHAIANKPPELIAAKKPTTISSSAPAKTLAVAEPAAEPTAALTGKAKRVLRRQTNKAKRKANRTSNSNSDAVAVSSKKAKEEAIMANIESDVKNRFGHGGKKSKRKMEGGFLEPPMDILFE
tara:strand:+ start:5761 stop:6405 length:645 start_codon:yes stop_codon:yes gene_type:complete